VGRGRMFTAGTQTRLRAAAVTGLAQDAVVPAELLLPPRHSGRCGRTGPGRSRHRPGPDGVDAWSDLLDDSRDVAAGDHGQGIPVPRHSPPHQRSRWLSPTARTRNQDLLRPGCGVRRILDAQNALVPCSANDDGFHGLPLASAVLPDGPAFVHERGTPSWTSSVFRRSVAVQRLGTARDAAWKASVWPARSARSAIRRTGEDFREQRCDEIDPELSVRLARGDHAADESGLVGLVHENGPGRVRIQSAARRGPTREGQQAAATAGSSRPRSRAGEPGPSPRRTRSR